MLRAELHQCPHCTGAIDRQNCARVRHEDRVDTWLYCDFCGVGWEMSEYPDGDVLTLDFHERTEPVNFQRFLARLAEARVA